MNLIAQEKLLLLLEHSGHILHKPEDHRTLAEIAWLKWAAKRIQELEGAK